MKKIVFLSLFALCLPWALSAQSVDDDLYYVPSKKKEEKTEKKKTPAADAVVVKTNAPTTVYASPGNTTIVVKDRKGNIRDVDEYNRRYDSKDYDFSQENDTRYIDEKEDDGLDGEWVNGFDGSEDDYEYATRIIRFRNPRYAISISSPLYWDVVYGLNPWDWNVYTDGLYAYAFPTFTNRLWWDWRYNSYGWGGYPYYGWGWNSWYGPSWSFGWGGWYGGGWWGHHHHHHHGHDADDVFISWGEETHKKFTKAEIEHILQALEDAETYGIILRAKGYVANAEGEKWIHFDYVPGESNIRTGSASVMGRLCVIGSKLNEHELSELFGV